MLRRLAIVLFAVMAGVGLLIASSPAMLQRPDNRQAEEKRVHLLHADRLYFDDRIRQDAQFLVGNVQFEHEGTLMYCDSALFYEASNSFDAYFNVLINQGDTLTLVGDELFYNGQDRLARVRHNVVLTHRETQLFTDSLDYDRMYDLGYFFEGGRLLDKDNELISDWGEYSPATRKATFNYNVRLQTPPSPQPARTVLLSDTLHYSTLNKVAHVVGPSNIEHGANHIYTEQGYYHTNTDFAYLLERSILQHGPKRLVGDSVVWDNIAHEGEAFGNAVYEDIENKNMLTGNYCYYNDSTGYAEALDSAVAIDYSQKDTMFAHADTFKLYTINIDTDSVYRILRGYHHMRAYRRDVQAVCDSMEFISRDSCLTMYRDPILWMGEQQLLGEEIKAFFNDSTIDSVHVLRQALSVERMNEKHYNQVAGHIMRFFFVAGEIDYSQVEGNVYLNYYPLDDDSLMIGMNHTETTLLKMYMENRKVQKIWMPAAQGTLYPIPLIPPDALYLENFQWFDYIRPKDRNDIFVWIPKHAGSELKESKRREPPTQKLKNITKKQNKE